MAFKTKVFNVPHSEHMARVGADNGGHVYFVKPSSAADYSEFYRDHFVKYDNGQSSIFNTLTAAIAACRASVGDVIYVCEGYAETITAASGIAANKAGVAILGLGVGNSRPRITISSTDNAGTIAISADNVAFKNIVVIGNDDALTNAVVVTGDNCDIDIETQDTSSAIEMATAVRLDTANNCKLKLRHNGFTGGNAMVSCVRLDDCDNVRIDIDGFGVLTTAWVEMVDVASTNVVVNGRTFTQGVTNGSRDIVDTITGSSWFGRIDDFSAGATYSGGSGSAWATDDITVVATAVGAVGDAALADTIEGAAATTQSLITDLKGVLQRIGADSANNTAATTLVDANDDGSLFERVEGLKDALILARGTFTTSSATVPADTGRTEANDYWNGCYLVPTAGAIIGQPRQIVDFANAGGVFTLDADVPFTAVPGTVAYVIIPGPGYIAPTADSTANTTPAHVTGRKTDAAVADTIEGAAMTTQSLHAMLKAALQRLGTDNANNTAATTLVAANKDGSLFERLEAMAIAQMNGGISVNHPNYLKVTADMTSATWNTQASHEILTVTGMVQALILPVVAGTLTDAADGASIQLGIEGSTTAIIGSTQCAGAGGNTLSTNEIWVDTSPADIIATKGNLDALTVVVPGGLDIGYEITGAALTGGSIDFHIWWVPLDATGAGAAGAGGAL